MSAQQQMRVCRTVCCVSTQQQLGGLQDRLLAVCTAATGGLHDTWWVAQSHVHRLSMLLCKGCHMGTVAAGMVDLLAYT
jgi:hypothetical protein